MNDMTWIDRLPEIGASLLKRRDQMAAWETAAEEMERRAAELRASIEEERGALMARISELWTAQEIERAKASAVVK
jgi:hypothetical protein